MLLSAFNELKAKEYRRFQCICDKITHWIPQSNNTWNSEVSTARRISRHLHPQHGQKAQRGGVLHLGTINGKNGILKGGKTKNGGISDNNDNARVTHRHVQGDLYGDVRAKMSQLLSSSPENASSYFLITYCATDATCCLTDATNWSHIKPLCNSRLAIWPVRSQTQSCQTLSSGKREYHAAGMIMAEE